MDQNIFFSQQDADHAAGDRAHMFMSRNATRASSLINSFIFVHCHKLIIVSVYGDRIVHLLIQKCGLQGFPYTHIDNNQSRTNGPINAHLTIAHV